MVDRVKRVAEHLLCWISKGGMIMKMTKNGWMLTTVPCFMWLFSSMGEKKKHQKLHGSTEMVENLEKLYELKEKGAITEEEYVEIKKRWMSEA